ncbi:hypothetical protein [Mesoplasma corruscae]|uniref:Uncharacterized protein n=1 Tax=Mesoplasma corruscae TaxID=216874 RepID=A0A2S5RHX1_9MOLU|nr:hypothetical protein [Mesoplasma corruscae]PPE06822.1 hypothetical protein MCORR_v1c04530 [Mesoplasma corruscae]
MKNFGKRLYLNIALCSNILIFIVLSIVAFFSVGFSDGVALGKGHSTISTPFFWLGIIGITLVVVAIVFPFIKIFNKKLSTKRILDIVNFALLSIAVALMLASQITFTAKIDKPDYFKLIGSCLLIFIGYSVTVQPQMKLIFIRSKSSKEEKPKQVEEDVENKKFIEE